MYYLPANLASQAESRARSRSNTRNDEGFDAEHHSNFAGMFSNFAHAIDTPAPLVLGWANTGEVTDGE